MPIPDYQALMLPVLVASSKGEVRIRGLVEELADHLTITPRGQTVLQSAPAHIDNKFLTQFEEFRQFRKMSDSAAETGSSAEISPALDLLKEKQMPDETMRMAHRQIDTALGQELLDRVREGTPEFVERLVVDLLLSLDRVYIQARRYAAGNSIGSGAIRDLLRTRPETQIQVTPVCFIFGAGALEQS